MSDDQSINKQLEAIKTQLLSFIKQKINYDSEYRMDESGERRLIINSQDTKNLVLNNAKWTIDDLLETRERLKSAEESLKKLEPYISHNGDDWVQKIAREHFTRWENEK